MSVQVDAPVPARPARPRKDLVIALGLGLVLVALIAANTYRIDQRNERLIEQALVAWFGGDVDGARDLFADEGDGIEVADGEIRYQEAIGARIGFDGCDLPRGSQIVCHISYSTALHEAVLRDAVAIPMTFAVVEDEVVLLNANYDRDASRFDPGIEGSYANFMLVEGLAVDYDAACFADPVRDVGCAVFQLEHLDEWAAWHLAQG